MSDRYRHPMPFEGSWRTLLREDMPRVNFKIPYEPPRSMNPALACVLICLIIVIAAIWWGYR